MDARAPDREQIDYLEAEVARLEGELACLREARVPGLSPAQSRILTLLEAANGRVVPFRALRRAVELVPHPGRGKGPVTDPDALVSAEIAQIRKVEPDIAARLTGHRGEGYALEPVAPKVYVEADMILLRLLAELARGGLCDHSGHRMGLDHCELAIALAEARRLGFVTKADHGSPMLTRRGREWAADILRPLTALLSEAAS